MADKRQGRQSAETARQTKLQILKTATLMFCEEGYASVSFRGIGDRAGISHSLIRHHFGSKLNMWKLISGSIHTHFISTMRHTLESQQQSIPNNQRLFNMLVALLANLLVDQRPMQLLKDVIQHKDELLEYFFAEEDDFSQQVLQLVEHCHEDGYGIGVDHENFKWLIASSAYSAVQLRPILLEMCGNNISQQQALKNHWQLFAKMLAAILSVPESKIPEVEQVFAAAAPNAETLEDFYPLD